MLFFFETPGGYALFKKKKSELHGNSFDLYSFYEYKSKIEAVKSMESLKNARVPRTLKQFLKNSSKKGQSLIINGGNLKEELNKEVGPFFKRILTKKRFLKIYGILLIKILTLNFFLIKKKF